MQDTTRANLIAFFAAIEEVKKAQKVLKEMKQRVLDGVDPGRYLVDGIFFEVTSCSPKSQRYPEGIKADVKVIADIQQV